MAKALIFVVVVGVEERCRILAVVVVERGVVIVVKLLDESRLRYGGQHELWSSTLL